MGSRIRQSGHVGTGLSGWVPAACNAAAEVDLRPCAGLGEPVIIPLMARVRKPTVDKSGRTSTGILLWRKRKGRLEGLLGHPGGPYFAGKDADHWPVLKGEVEPGEDLVAVARREFTEETGHQLADGPRIELGDIRQKSGKLVLAWAVEGNLDPETAVSNSFEMEWPPRSGRVREFPGDRPRRVVRRARGP